MSQVDGDFEIVGDLASSETLHWDVDASERDNEYGFHVLLLDDYDLTCSFRFGDDEVKKVIAQPDLGVTYSAVEGLNWNQLVLTGTPTLPELSRLSDLCFDSSSAELVVTATTRGATRKRWLVSLPLEAWPDTSFEIVLSREDLRGRIEVCTSIVLSKDIPSRPGYANLAYTRLAIAKPITVDVDRIEGIPGSSMLVSWEDFGGDKSLYKLEISSDENGCPTISVRLNNKDQSLKVVMDTEGGGPERIAARRFINSLIAVDVFTQLTQYARQLDIDGDDIDFLNKLKGALIKKGVPTSAFQAESIADCAIEANYALQNKLGLHPLVSKLINAMGVEEGSDDIQT